MSRAHKSAAMEPIPSMLLGLMHLKIVQTIVFKSKAQLSIVLVQEKGLQEYQIKQLGTSEPTIYQH